MYPNTKFIIGSLPKGGWRINPILFASKQVIPKRTYKNKLILIRNHAGDMYSCQPTYQKKYIHIGQRSEWQMTESAVALGVVGIDRLGGGSGGGGGPSRISDLQVRSGPKMGHCGQRGSEENTANTSKNGPELYIVIARNILGTAQNTVNYGKICVFAFLGRCVSSLASGDGGHKTLQIALKIGCLAFSGAIFSAR